MDGVFAMLFQSVGIVLVAMALANYPANAANKHSNIVMTSAPSSEAAALVGMYYKDPIAEQFRKRQIDMSRAMKAFGERLSLDAIEYFAQEGELIPANKWPKLHMGNRARIEDMIKRGLKIPREVLRQQRDMYASQPLKRPVSSNTVSLQQSFIGNLKALFLKSPSIDA